MTTSSSGALPGSPTEELPPSLPPFDLFSTLAAHAAWRSDEVAVVDGDSYLTYGDLHRRAQALALHLRASGVKSGDAVGLCARRGARTVVAMVGILLADAAFVPMDPADPPQRLRALADGADVTSVVSAEEWHPVFGALGLHCVDTAGLEQAAAELPDGATSVVSEAGPDDIAYIIHTSGTTGVPKGVMVRRDSLRHFCRNIADAYQLVPGDRVLQFSSISFDSCIDEIFPPLLVGATVVIRDDEMISSPATFLRRCAELRISVAITTTAYWHELVDGMAADGLTVPDTVRLVRIAGEEARQERVRDWRLLDRDGRVRLVNVYGPTETTVIVTYDDLAGPLAAPGAADEPPTIGRPLPGVITRVVDAEGRPVADGVDGELLIGGPTVAVGYVNRPELTAERFVGTPDGERCYRSGDRVRRLPDGRFLFLGRIDRQVKVRGFRVELVEVEGALRAQSRVRDAVVRYDKQKASLIAYLLLTDRDDDRGAPDRRARMAEIRRGLRLLLPSYAIPSLLVPVEVFPLTSRGKVDVAALAAQDPTGSDSGTGTTGPAAESSADPSGVGGRLAAVITETLGIPSIGRHDSVFALGAHSLLAIRILTRVRREFGTELTLADLYANPTVEALSRLLADSATAASEVTYPAVAEHSGEANEANEADEAEHEGLPLIAFQQDCWLTEEYQPGTPVDTLGLRYRLTGPAESGRVASALDRVVAKHDALRAVFRVSRHAERYPRMVFGAAAPVPPVPLTVHDLIHLPPAERESEARRLAEEHGRTVLDLENGPLLAGLLVRLEERTWELVVAVHHMVFDGWSAGVLADDLARDLAAGEGAPNAARSGADDANRCAAGYAAHLRHEARAATSPARARLRRHWADQLSGIDTEIELPGDRPRPPVRSFAGAKLVRRLDPGLLARVEEAARTHGTTAHTVVLAALQTLVARLSGRTDITVLAPVAHRTEPEHEDTVGAFINVLPLRTDLSGDPDFATVVRRADQTVVRALDHQELPLADIVEALDGVRYRADRSPLGQVMLIVLNTPSTVVGQGGVTVERLGQTFSGHTKLDLTITLDLPASGPTLSAEYATDLFDEATAEAMLDELIVLLGNALGAPESAVSTLELLSERRRLAVLEHGCAAPAQEDEPEDGDHGVHRLVTDYARTHPHEPAVRLGDETWDYATLTAEAERLAATLRARGVRRGDRVALHLPRGPLLLAAVLAAWQAGAAYVPLDPDYPEERLRHMVTDSGAGVVLTTAKAKGFTPPAEVASVECDRPDGYDAKSADARSARPTGHEPAEAEPPAALNADDAAYVLYTSGTTGTPKGVVVSHGNLRHAVAMWRSAYGLQEGWTHLQAASSSFDVFVGESLRALCTGGQLVVCPREVLLDPDALHRLLRDRRIQVAELVPTVLRGLLDHVEQAGEDLSFLSLLAGGSEKWYAHEYRRARALVGPGGRVVNSYGVTEATVDSAYWEGDADALTPSAPLPIGGPYPGTRLYTLDGQGAPVPFGVVGELWIGGPGVALGYHDRPRLTRERFRPDPFAGLPGARMYRTGDSARMRHDGTVEFLGRLDDQVKLNGHRIELAEVEAALAALPAVREAAAAVRLDRRGVPTLTAYVVAAEAATAPTASELRAELRDILPHYAIPARSLAMPALPLSPNGKVDRKALPEPPEQSDDTPAAVLETPAQRRMARLWGEVLACEEVGPDDGFFELGGDSFTALRLIRALEAERGVRIGLLDLYRLATVRLLAEYLDGLESGPGAADTGGPAPADRLLHRLTSERKGPVTGTLVCIPYSGGQAVAFEPMATALPADWALYALQSPGRDWSRPDETALPIDELVERCLAEMRELSGPLHIYGHCHGSAITIELALRAEAAGLPVAGVGIGAIFPMARLPGPVFDWVYRHFQVDRLISDRAILSEIRALGMSFPDIEDRSERDFLMNAIRHDERNSENYFAHTLRNKDLRRIEAPFVAVVGEKDRITELHTERYHEWEHFADNVELAVIPKAGHAFLRNQPERLADVLVNGADRVEAAPDTGPPGTADRAWREPRPGFGRFSAVAAGQFVSVIGSALSQLVMSLWVFDQTGRIADFAYVAAVALLPGILVGPVAGAVADRYDRRKVMLAADVAAGLVTAAMVVVLGSGGLTMGYVYAFCAATSICSAFQQPAYLAAVAQLVPKAFLGKASGITQLGAGAGTLLAPAFAAGLLGVLPVRTILLLDMTTYVVAVVSLLLVRFPNRLFKHREEPMLREIAQGWRYIARRPGMTAALRLFVIDHFIYTLGFALITPMVLIEHGMGTLGTMLSAGGLGALLGALTMSVWGGTRRRTEGMLIFMWCHRAGQLLIAVSGEPWLIVTGMFTLAFSESVINGHWYAFLQTKVGLELQGRVLATYMALMMLTMPVGYAIIGPLADRYLSPLLMPGTGALAGSVGAVIGTGRGRGLALVVLASAVLLVGWTLYGWLDRRFHYMEDVMPDAVPDTEIEDRDTEQRRADALLATTPLATTVTGR